MQAEGVREAQLRGPLPFPQERLLSYFWNLLKSEGDDGGAFNQNEGAAQQQQSAEVFMLLRSLVSLRLLSQARINIWLLCTHVGDTVYSSCKPISTSYALHMQKSCTLPTVLWTLQQCLLNAGCRKYAG